jgi:uncharacterized DUF497 family protein
VTASVIVHTITSMKIDFDPEKDESNRSKHGLSLADAVALDWETLLAKRDLRREYGEERMIGYALMADRLCCVVYADRDDVRRVISLRKANRREVRAYVLENQIG